MDKLDQKLYNDLSMQMETPDKLDTIIKNGLNQKNSHGSILKKIASFLIIIFATSGIVFAAGVAYENYEKNIWKTPQKVTGENAQNNDNQNETKQNTMSEEEARKKGQEIFEKFGYGNDKIKTIKLEGSPDNYDLKWYIETEQKILIDFDANGEGSFSILNQNKPYNKDIQKYRTSTKEAEKIARELAKKYGYDTEQYKYIKVSSNMNSDSESYIWNVAFYKEYEGVVNPYERIQISFIPEINDIICFIFIDKKFENNPIEITEEEAKEIALKEEEKINVMYEIKSIETNLKIEAMNGYAYLRTNDYEQLLKQTESSYPYAQNVFYRTESRARRIWLVTIVYDIPNKFDKGYNPNNERVSYFIDVTTGEVIGGGSIF